MPARSRVPLVVAAAAGLVAVLAVRSLAGGGTGGGGVPAHESAARRDCVTLHVAASSEKAALLTSIAQDRDRTGPVVGGRCAAVEVTSTASGAAI